MAESVYTCVFDSYAVILASSIPANRRNRSKTRRDFCVCFDYRFFPLCFIYELYCRFNRISLLCNLVCNLYVEISREFAYTPAGFDTQRKRAANN